MDAGSRWAGRMTSEASVSSSPAISKSPAKGDYYWLRSFVAGGRTEVSCLCAHLSASDGCVKLVQDTGGSFKLCPKTVCSSRSQLVSSSVQTSILTWSNSYNLSVSSLVAAELYPLIGDVPVLAELWAMSYWFSWNTILVVINLLHVYMFLSRCCRMLCQDDYCSSGQSQNFASSSESTLQTSW